MPMTSQSHYHVGYFSYQALLKKRFLLTMSEVYRIQHVDEAQSHLSPTFLDNLTLHTVPIPSQGPEAVLVRTRAVSFNYRDLLIVAGSPLYPTQAQSGLIQCCDGAGEIVSTGRNSKCKDSIRGCCDRYTD